ncbi:hypothetical protein MPSEU_000033200 [Mayamaea pseudoterrestris]|nr:hypothetical protein MPSEU_000033200 [Mayamaea pseudoterrestris]
MNSSIEITMDSLLGCIEIEEASPTGSLESRLLEVTKKTLKAEQALDDDATASTALDYYSESESSIASSSFCSCSSSSSSRSVYFDLSANVSHDNTTSCQEDLLDLWHDAHDYKEFKRQTYSLAKQMDSIEQRNRAPHSYSRTLTRTYEICASAAAIGSDSDTTTSSMKRSLLSTLEAKHLQHWASATPCRLGLDKWALPELQRERSQRKHTLKRAIMELQTQAKHFQSQQNDNEASLEDCMRRTSERMSRTGTYFARHLAMSLAAAEANQVSEA